MWAIGVIIYQLLCGSYPFNHTNQTRLFTVIRRGEFDFNPDPWINVSEEAKVNMLSLEGLRQQFRDVDQQHCIS